MDRKDHINHLVRRTQAKPMLLITKLYIIGEWWDKGGKKTGISLIGTFKGIKEAFLKRPGLFLM